MNSLRLRSVLAVSLAVAAVVAFASPASADPSPRALPTGSSLYALNCDGRSPDLQLFSVNTESAAATTIGVGTVLNGGNCASQPAWDAVTRAAYYVGWGDSTFLAKVNLVTGVSTNVGDFTFDGESADVNAIAIGAAGNAYALTNGRIYSLDLSTGALSAPVTTTLNNAYGFAFDPANATFYAITYYGFISAIDPATGVLTSLGQTDLSAGTDSTYTYSLQIDSAGIFWIENNGQDADLWTLDPAAVATSAQLVNPITHEGQQFYTEALLIAPTQVAPAITTAPSLGAAVAGTAFSLQVAATGTGPISFALTGTLPPGLVLDPATGMITGTPVTPGTYSYTITATNESGTSVVEFTQTITAALPVVSG